MYVTLFLLLNPITVWFQTNSSKFSYLAILMSARLLLAVTTYLLLVSLTVFNIMVCGTTDQLYIWTIDRTYL